MDSPLICIKSQGDPKKFRTQLERDWLAGEVADITLVDGTEVSGVLIGISNLALIVDGWDDETAAPADDPFVLDLAVVIEVLIP